MITQERLFQVLIYNPETGEFTNKAVRKGTRGKGKPAGTINQEGYLSICIDRKKYAGHRLAWIYVFGENPNMDIDHINGIRSDNRICNLRSVSRSCNLKNMKPRIDGEFRGLRRVGESWHVYIRINGRQLHLGAFRDKSLAVSKLLAERRKYGFSDRHSSAIQ